MLTYKKYLIKYGMRDMSYNFTFDLSKLSQNFFKDIAEFSEKGKVTKKMGHIARTLVKKFNINKITGMPIGDSITVIEDILDIYIKNSLFKESFQKTGKRALFLPHCCRKYMDTRCKADFQSETSSYHCNHCSKDCMVHQATKIAKKENYDVYILPGASCIRKIFQKNSYEGVVGVACTDELKLAVDIIKQYNISAQGIPLIKNGCSETQFNFDTLSETIKRNDD